jgi:hypothetical protein
MLMDERKQASKRKWLAFVIAWGTGVLVFLAGYLLAKWKLETMSVGLFIALPSVMSGASSAYLARHGFRLSTTLGLSLLPPISALLLLIWFAWEGLLCALIALPIIALASLIGAGLGYAVGRRFPVRNRLLSVAFALPLFVMAVEAHLQDPNVRHEVSTTLEIAAPPSTVWRYAGEFPTIPDGNLDWPFSLGVPYPTRSSLAAAAVGATRECYFSSFVAIERVEIWEPEHLLHFAVVTAEPWAL